MEKINKVFKLQKENKLKKHAIKGHVPEKKKMKKKNKDDDDNEVKK